MVDKIKQSKKEVKEYYIKQLAKLFSEIENIPDEELKGLPFVHIPSIGFTDEMPNIAFYGIETSGWFYISDVKKRFYDDPSIAYDYLTKTKFTPTTVINYAKPRKHIFWRYVIRLLASIYGLNLKQIKTEDILKKHSFIWGNTNALERFEVSAKSKGGKREVYDEIKKKSYFLNTLPNGQFGPTYIVRACQPKLLFILDRKFDLENWLKNEFSIGKENIHKYISYAYIKETDTSVFQLPHPRFMTPIKMYHPSIKQVLKKLESTGQIPERNPSI